MSVLVFPDAASLTDLRTYAARLRRLDPDGALRLHASGGLLAAYAGVLPGRGVTGSGAVIGLRILTLAKPAQVDATVPASAILDRLARTPRPGGPFTLPVPPVSVFVSWAGVAPPRTGWSVIGDLDAASLELAAQEGIAEIAAAGTGLAAQVEALRARVWSAPFAEGTPAPRGLAFAAYGLGFVRAGEPARLSRAGTWWRLTTPIGHALGR
ncbi:MAG: hypothetical protein U0Q21_02685 [Dermatophilaceae bacterium]